MPEQIAQIRDGFELCYETFGSPDDPPLLLVMKGIDWFVYQRLGYADIFPIRVPALSQRIRGSVPRLSPSLFDAFLFSAVIASPAAHVAVSVKLLQSGHACLCLFAIHLISLC